MRTFDLLNLEHSGLDTVTGLFRKAHAQMWDADASIDWSNAPTPEDDLVDTQWVAYSQTDAFKGLTPRAQRHFANRALGHLLNSFVLAESVAQQVSLMIGLRSRLADHRAHAAAQALDESRHHLVLQRVVESMGGDLEPVDGATRAIFDGVLAEDDLARLVCWEQFYLESVAVSVLADVARHATHPLVKQVFTLILRDESRHMGFGIVFVERMLRDMNLDERIEFAREWLPRILAAQFNHQDPVTFSRTVRWLREGGVDNSVELAWTMMAQQQAVLARQHRDMGNGSRLPQELKSARRVGLLQTEILEELGLRDHPLVRGALRLPDEPSAA